VVTDPNPKPKRERLDVALVARGLVESRARAQALIMAGKVEVAGQRVDKAGAQVTSEQPITLLEPASRFVSRGGEKLAGALESFKPLGLTVPGKVAADLGASTGGFTDCLLQSGAVKVYAVDVGTNLLHERLRSDPRVVVLDKTNARELTVEQLGGQPMDLVVVDASFIGLGKLLDAIHRIVKPAGELVALIKPQFEAGKEEVSKGRGVIRDETVRAQVIAKVLDELKASGFEALGDAECVLPGPKGNREHFVYMKKA
jgi:23S rRNA (cytidine1920-2'-O)/16S rRNA (cytidine1409-2'-O)-methyltransferase